MNKFELGEIIERVSGDDYPNDNVVKGGRYIFDGYLKEDKERIKLKGKSFHWCADYFKPVAEWRVLDLLNKIDKK